MVQWINNDNNNNNNNNKRKLKNKIILVSELSFYLPIKKLQNLRKHFRGFRIISKYFRHKQQRA